MDNIPHIATGDPVTCGCGLQHVNSVLVNGYVPGCQCGHAPSPQVTNYVPTGAIANPPRDSGEGTGCVCDLE